MGFVKAVNELTRGSESYRKAKMGLKNDKYREGTARMRERTIRKREAQLTKRSLARTKAIQSVARNAAAAVASTATSIADANKAKYKYMADISNQIGQYGVDSGDKTTPSTDQPQPTDTTRWR